MKSIIKLLMLISALIVTMIIGTSIVSATEIVDEGTCGDNVIWSLDEDGLLTIEGEGDMYDYTASEDNPFYEKRIKNVVVNQGVTSIGSYTFYDSVRLKSIIIPAGLEIIGDHAFSGCTALMSVDISGSVYSIGANAFDGCIQLSTITLHEGTTSIGQSAFAGTAITVISLPEGLNIINDNLFSGCTALESIVVPDGITSIGSSAFNSCTSLKGITLPESLESIGDWAFVSCSSLTNVSFSNNVFAIGEGAFYNCSSLETVILPENMTTVSNRVFYQCFSLKEIIIPEGVTSIGYDAFYGCTSLSEITIPKNVTAIGDNAFYNDLITVVVLCEPPGKITDAFNGVAVIQYPCISDWTEDERALWHTDAKWKVIHNFGEVIPGTTTIECIDCGEIIDTNIFEEGACGDYLTWTLDKKGTLTISGTGEMPDYQEANAPYSEYSELINSIIIEKGVTKVGSYAFSGLSKASSVSLSNTISSVGNNAFKECNSIEEIHIDDLQSYLSISFVGTYSHPNNTYNRYNRRLNIGSPDKQFDMYLGGEQLKNITIPSNITIINELVFYGCSIEKVDLHSGLRTIGWSAFRDCFSLTEIDIPGSVETIEGCAFEGCKSMSTIKLNEGLETIYYYAFEGVICSYLELPVSAHYIDLDFFSSVSDDRMTIKFKGEPPEVAEDEDGTKIDNWIYAIQREGTTIIFPCGSDAWESIYRSYHGSSHNSDLTFERSHTWNNNYTVDNESTCTEEGFESIHCSVCNSIQEGSTRSIAKKDHEWESEYTIDEPATCVEEGIESQHCSRCNAKQNERAIPATGHAYQEVTDSSKDATCTEAGKEADTKCVNCNKIIEGSTIPALGHNYELLEGTEKLATIEEDGHKANSECSNCHDVIVGETIHHPANYKFASVTYNGKVQKPVVTVMDANGVVIDSSNYDVSYSNNVNAGTAARAVITFKGSRYTGTKNDLTFKINKANQKMTVKASIKKLNVKKLKKKAQVVAAITVSKQGAAPTYKKLSGSAKLTVNAKTGKITVKKKTKKGTYKIKVRVTSGAVQNYNAAYRDVLVTVKVK